MDPTDVGVRFRWLATAPLGAIAVGGAVDLALDQPTTLWSFHVLFEVGLLALSLSAVAYLWLGWRDARQSLEQTRTPRSTSENRPMVDVSKPANGEPRTAPG